MTNYFEKVFTPKDLGLNYLNGEEIYGGDTPGQRDVIIDNAVCGIAVMDRNKSIEESVSIAREGLESGRALETFRKFVELNL